LIDICVRDCLFEGFGWDGLVVQQVCGDVKLLLLLVSQAT